MFQICNLENNIYRGGSGRTSNLEDNINVLDYDDLTIETVNFDLCIPLFRSSFVAHKSEYGMVFFLAYLDRQDYNDLIQWRCHLGDNSVQLKVRGTNHKIRLRTCVMAADTLQDITYCRIQYDSTYLFEFSYVQCELHVNYAFRYKSYLILRMTVYTLGLRDQITPIYSFSLVFRDEVLLGLYVTYALSNNYHVIKPIPKELESKLMFFLRDKW